MSESNNVRQTLARNLDSLMKRREPRWTQTALAKASGVSQRTISNMLSGNADDKSGATLDRVDAVAKVFGLRSWHLLMPNFPSDFESLRYLADVVDAYISADDDGKDLIRKVAEREGQYRKQA